MENKTITDSLIIGMDFANNGDQAVMVVGRKTPGEVCEIVNAFSGDDALTLYALLTEKKDKQE